MAGNPFFSGRIPKELNEQVVKHCEETGTSKTEVLIAALSSYLNIPIPERCTNSQAEVTKEQFLSLEHRVKSLENLLHKNIVITEDNNDNESIEKVSSNDNVTENIDNPVSQTEEKLDDNVLDNADNKDYTTMTVYKNIDSKRLSELTDLKASEKVNLRNQAFKKAEKEGYEINKEVRFNPAIEASLRRGIIINGSEYKLLCEGTDEKEKPIWSLKPYDNISYQPDILSNTN